MKQPFTLLLALLFFAGAEAQNRGFGIEDIYVPQPTVKKLTMAVRHYADTFANVQYDSVHPGYVVEQNIPDSLLYYIDQGSGFKNERKIKRHFDSSKRILTDEQYYWNSAASNYDTNYIYVYTYHPGDTGLLSYSFYTGTFTHPQSRDLYYYTGTRLDSVHYLYYSSGAMQLYDRSKYYYSAGSVQPDSVVKEHFIVSWQNDKKTEYKYSSGLLTKQTHYYWTAGAWVADERSSFTYGSANHITVQIDESIHSGVLGPTYRYTFTYDGAGRTIARLSEYYTSAYTNVSKDSFQFTANRLARKLSYNWIAASSWKESDRRDYAYDADGDMITFIDSSYGLITPTYYKYDRAPNGIGETEASTLILYPNPTSGNINVKSESEISGYKVYDAAGRLVAINEALKGTLSTVIYLNREYGTGEFFVEVKTGKGTEKRMVIVTGR